MSQSETVFLHNDILIRRIPPTSDAFCTIASIGRGRYRAASSMMSLGDDEEDLSCSLLRLTTPVQLLDYLKDQQKDPEVWYVCAFRLRDVVSLEFEVRHTPVDGGDIGHCSISSAHGGPRFPNSKAKKLAKITVVLNQDEIHDVSLIEAMLQ